MQDKYLNLDLDEKDLMADGKYLLAAFKVIPAEGEDLTGLATEIASESSTGSNMRVSTATDFSDSMNALVYSVDEAGGIVKIAYPIDIFDRGGNVQNIMTYIAGNLYGMSSLSGLRLEDVWMPQAMLDQHQGPSYTLKEVKEYLGVGDRPILGTIVKPKIGLKPKEFAAVAYEFWVGGGDFVKFDEPQADQVFCPFTEAIDEIAEVMKKVEEETGQKKMLSVNVSSPDFDTMIERCEYVKSKMEKGSYGFLVDGITAGWMAVQTARRKYPDVFIHFHRAGHGPFTRPENVFGFSVPVLAIMGRLSGSSAIHTGTAGIGKMKGSKKEDVTAVNATFKQVSKGFYFEQDWGNIKPCSPIASGGLNPTKLAAVIDAFGTTDFVTTMGAGCHSHPDGTRSGATALVQACEAWQKNMSIEDYAKDHEELARAIEKFSK